MPPGASTQSRVVSQNTPRPRNRRLPVEASDPRIAALQDALPCDIGSSVCGREIEPRRPSLSPHSNRYRHAVTTREHPRARGAGYGAQRERKHAGIASPTCPKTWATLDTACAISYRTITKVARSPTRLRHETDLPPQPLQVERTQVDPIEKDHAGLGVVEAQQQAHHGRLAAPRCSHLMAAPFRG